MAGKSPTTLLSACLVLMAMVLTTAPAHAVNFMNDEFTDGDYTANPPWTIPNGREYSTFEVQQDMGRDALVRTDSQNDDGFLETLARSPANTGSPATLDRNADTIIARAVVRFNGDDDSKFSLRVQDNSGAGYRLQVNPDTEVGGGKPAWQIHRDVGGFGIVATGVDEDNGLPVVNDTDYYTIDFYLYPNGDLEGFLDGTSVVSGNHSGLMSFNKLQVVPRFSTGLSGGDHVFFDSLRIDTNVVPEPASLALLTLGGAGLLRRRRMA